MTQSPVRKRDRTRAALLDVALELFAEQGYDATTIDDIAAAAGVARQTVLNHYPRKDEFVRAWGDARRARVADEVEGANAGGARDRLARVYRALATINEQERALTAALHLVYQAIYAERPVPEIVIAEVSAARERGEFRAEVDPHAAAEVLTAVYFDTLSRWLVSGAGTLADALDAKLAVVLDGLAVSTPARSGAVGSARPRVRRSATTRRSTR